VNSIRKLFLSLYVYILLAIGGVLRLILGIANESIDFEHPFKDWLVILALIISLLAFIWSCMNVWHYYQESRDLFHSNKLIELSKRMKTSKLGLIPFYILNYVFYVFLFLLSFAVSRGFILFHPLMIIFIFASIYTYAIVVLTSYDGIALINIYYKNNVVSKNMFLIITGMQLLFVVDVLATLLILFNKDFLDYQQESYITSD